MTSDIFLLLPKLQSTILILVKVIILLKYFTFMRYRTSDWRTVHFVYFPAAHINSEFEADSIKVKKTQNLLSIVFILLNIALIAVRTAL